VEQEEWWTAQRYRQPAYVYSSKVQRLEESPQRWHGHGNIRQNRIGALSENAAVLAGDEMRGAVVMSLAGWFAFVLRCQRGTVSFP